MFIIPNKKGRVEMAAVKKAPAKKTVSKSTSKKSPVSKPAAKNMATKKTPAKKGAAKELKDLFEDGLKDIYWAEKALTKALPKMQKNATSEKLKNAIATHISQTEDQIKKIEACFKALGKKPQAKKCEAMQGLIDEGNSILQETKPGAVRDAGIIASSQKVEHYEIASYGTLAAFAKVLGEEECLKHLLEIKKQEKQTDQLLTDIADTQLNTQAM